MSKVRIMGTSLMAVLALSLIAAPGALANGRPLHASLDGASEVPGPGDTDGAGTARLRLNQGRHRICYSLEVTDITLPATAAHIHLGAAGVAGPVEVPLGAPDANGLAQGCVTGLERALIKAIRQHPREYYVNVYNADFPAGAIRGQLSK